MPAFAMAQRLGEVIPMKQYRKYGILPLAAWLVCLGAEIINVKGSALPQSQVEVLLNIAMLATAIFGFFYLGLPAKINLSHSLYGFLCNLSVSGIAFVMNVAVYGHSIRWDHLWEDLFCWHICWVLCVFIQILFLTVLGAFLWRKCQGLLSSAKQCGKGALQSAKKAVQSIMPAVKRIDKNIFITVCVGLVVWGIYLGTSVYAKGIISTFSDVSVIGESVWLWLEIIVICGLLRLLPSVFHKSAQAIQAADNKKVLFGMGCVSLGVLLRIYQFPIWAVVLISMLLVVFIKMAEARRTHISDTGTYTKASNVDPILPTFICCFLLPLVVLFISTLLSSEGRAILENQEWKDTRVLLELINAMGQTATNSLNLKP